MLKAIEEGIDYRSVQSVVQIEVFTLIKKRQEHYKTSILLQREEIQGGGHCVKITLEGSSNETENFTLLFPVAQVHSKISVLCFVREREKIGGNH